MFGWCYKQICDFGGRGADFYTDVTEKPLGWYSNLMVGIVELNEVSNTLSL